MQFHTERVCRSLDALDKEHAIRTIHEALLHLKAGQTQGFDCLDDSSVIENLENCMRQAGHMGYT